MTNRKLLPSILLLATLGGCLGAAPPVPRDHFYRIEVEVIQEPPARLPGTISVSPIDAEGLMRERPMLFSIGDAHEIQQHDYHYWIESPPRMLQGQLVDFLRQSGAADSVITPDLRLPADFEVTGRIRRFERVLRADATRVVVELELAMADTGGKRLVVVQSYGAEVPAEDAGVEASVRAMDLALSDIFTRFLADAGIRSREQRAAAGKD